MFIFLLNLYLNVRLTQFWLRHKKSDMKNLIKNACLKIHSKLCKKWYQLQYQLIQIKEKVRIQWTETWLKNEHQKNLSAFKILFSKWKQQREIEKFEWELLKIRKSKCAAIKQHAAFHKTENTMIIQIKINKIDFITFLNKIWVSEIEFSVYQCDWMRETAVHVIKHCFCFAEIKHQITDSHTN